MTLPARTVLAVHPAATLYSADRLFLECVSGLLGAGCRVVAVLPGDGPLVPALEQLGAEVRSLPMPLGRVERAGRLLPVQLVGSGMRGLVAGWRLLGAVRPDVVLLSTGDVPQWAVLARLRRVDAVGHLHQVRSRGRRWADRRLLAPYRFCTRVLVSDEESVHALRPLAPDLAARAEVLRAGIAAPMRPRPPREPLEAPLDLLFLGRLTPHHGPDVLLAAAADLHRSGTPARLTVLGDAPAPSADYGRRLRRLACQSDASVDILDLDPDIWPHLDAADIIALPHRSGSCSGRAALEAILAMRPVLASDTPDLRTLLVDYPTVHLVPPGDAGALARTISALAQDWSGTVTTLARSRELALRRHDPREFHAAIARACGVVSRR